MPVTGGSGTPGACAASCDASDVAGWRYVAGTTYVYDYQVETETAVRGTSDQTSFVTFKARAKVAVMDACNFQLTVSYIEIGLNLRFAT